MTSKPSVQAAHDALLADGVTHEPCSLCPAGVVPTQKAKEVASVAEGDEVTYTGQQHVALLRDAVERETASLTSANAELNTEKAALETTISELTAAKETAEAQVDVLTAAKETAEQKSAVIQKEFDDFKAELDRQREVAERRAERVEKIRTAAPQLSDEFLSDESRQARWAEMADDAFDALVESLGQTASGAPAAAGSEAASAAKPAPAQRESAAFTGGEAPTSTDSTSGLRSLMPATGRLPAGAKG